VRQNAMASAGAAVAAMIGPDVETAATATVMVMRSAVGGSSSTAGTADASLPVTRKVWPMDAAAISALIDEATKKAGLVWVRAAGQAQRAQGVWHVWQDGSAYVLTGGLEQSAPSLGERGYVTVPSKDKKSRLVTWVADVSVVHPESELWDAVVPALQVKRLNSPDGDEAPQRWARDCTLYRLTPTGEVTETPDAPSTISHATPPPASSARTRVPRPMHVRGRPPVRTRGREP
jgi:hypothetical protein